MKFITAHRASFATLFLLPVVLAGACSKAGVAPLAAEQADGDFHKLTPILTVDSIEASLPFWIERVGFEQTMEVPGDDGLAFVALQGEGIEVMLQTRASLAADLPAVASAPGGASFLYLEVNDLESLMPRFTESEVAVPDRVTFYGMRELVLRSPGGHFLTLAQPVPSEGE